MQAVSGRQSQGTDQLSAMSAAGAGMEAYIDEEQALAFHVWVAELELLVGTAKGRVVDQVAAFELLQKVLVTIDTTDVLCVREYQRRCELALLDILLKGAAPPVRRLACQCTARLYSVGDTLPLYSRASGLVSLLAARDARGLPPPVRLGALQCLAALCEAHGRTLAGSMAETLAAALKHAGRGTEPAVRAAALELAASVVGGLGGGDRSSGQVQLDAAKSALRAARDAADGAGRLAAASILRAVAQAGGGALWANLSWYEEAVKLCISSLDAEDRTAADAFAAVLGDLAAAARSEAAAAAVRAWERKPGKQAALQAALEAAPQTLLAGPFVDAAAAGRWPACKALTQAWLAFLAHVQERGEGDGELVRLAAAALGMLADVSARGGAGGGGAEDGDGEQELGAPLSGGELPPAQACVLYVVRVGVIERLTEPGQRAMLERLAALLASEAAARPPLAAAALEAAGLLLEVLGEISPEQAAALEQPAVSALTAPSSAVRRQAAGLLAALATAEPASAARLLRQRLAALSEAAVRVAGALQGEATEVNEEAQLPGSPKGLFAAEAPLRPLLDELHGHALGAAALLVAAARLPLGVPSRLLLDALGLAERLTSQPASKRAAGGAGERQAGYILAGALPLALPPELLTAERQRLVQLWQAALAAESAAELDLRRYLTISQARAEVSMSMELWWRAAALQALKALILCPLVSGATAEAQRLQRRVAAILQPTLAVVLASPVMQDPQRAKGTLGGACAVFQLRLLEAYLALPQPAAFASEHQALSRLCSRAFRGSAAQPNSAPEAAAAAARGTLRMLLNRQDAPLGPWVAGRGPLEDALHAFDGAPGGPARPPWQAGLPFSAGSPGAGPDQPEPFSQPRALSAALLEQQLVLLGSLLASVSEANQLLILDVLTAAAAAPPPKRGLREHPGRRRAVLTSLCCAALAGLDSLARRYRGQAGERDGVAERARALADAALEEGVALADGALLRAAAEMYALAACIGSDGHAVQLLRQLCGTMEAAATPARRACLGLALGCVYRSKGGLALQRSVGRTAGSLLAVARSSSGQTQAWLLHALWLLANAAGLALLPHVQGTLALEMELVMGEEAAALPGMRPALARLANALVAVLGPELTPGSAAYARTRCLLLDLQGLASKATSAEEATMAALERVLYAQMLVLFAPAATPAASHLPLLLATLRSRQPALRRAAADTLRHLAERDPEAMLPAAVEPRLLAALDGEPDAGVAAQLQASLRTLLAAGAPTRPGHCLAVCTAVIFSSPPPPAAAAPETATAPDEEDSDEEAAGTAARAAAAPQPAPQAAAAQEPKAGGGTRLRTREFAAQCLLALPELVAGDPRHLDPALAQAAPGDWLVTHLQALVDAAFNLATGGAEALRPHGLRLLRAILARFGDAPDPLLDGGRLLEQSQAQFVSALRVALTTEAAPSLLAAGALLAADFVESGLAAGDAALLARLIGLMGQPLAAALAHPQEQYAEWVEARARIALLEAHASCAGHLLSSRQPGARRVLADAQARHPGMLMGQWLALLQDWLVLGWEAGPVATGYRARLAAAAPHSALLPLLAAAWPPVLAAACRLLEAGCEEGARELPTDAAGYQLLLDACLAPVCNAAVPGSRPAVAPAELAAALAGLRRLLGARLLAEAWCSEERCREAVTAVGGLLQHGELPGEALQAAAGVVRQACAAVPTCAPILSRSLAEALAAALLAALDAAATASGPGAAAGAAAAAAALQAGGLLAARAEATAAVRARVALRAAALLKTAEQAAVLEAAAGCLLAAAQASAAALASEPGTEAGALASGSGGGQAPGAAADMLAFSAAAASAALSRSLPHPEPTRLAAALPLVLSLGGLLPVAGGTPLPPLPAPAAAAPPPLAPAAAAAERAPAAAAAPEAADEWGSEGGFQEAGSVSDGWADDEFQAAEAAAPEAPEAAAAGAGPGSPAGAAAKGRAEAAAAQGGWEPVFSGAGPTAPGGGETAATAARVSGAEEPAPLRMDASGAASADATGDARADGGSDAAAAASALRGGSRAAARPADAPEPAREQPSAGACEAAEGVQAAAGARRDSGSGPGPPDSPAAAQPAASEARPDAAEADVEAAEGSSGGEAERGQPPMGPAAGGVPGGSAAGAALPAADGPASPEPQPSGCAAADQKTEAAGLPGAAAQQPEAAASDDDIAASAGAGGSPGPGPQAGSPAGAAQQLEPAAEQPEPLAEQTEAAAQQPPEAAEAAASDDDFADFAGAGGSPAASSAGSPATASRPAAERQPEPVRAECGSAGADAAAAADLLLGGAGASQVPGVLVTARAACLQALAGALEPGVAPVAQAKALAAVRAQAQQGGGQPAPGAAAHWAASCALTLAAPAARAVEQRAGAGAELSQEQALVASETLKLLHASLALLGAAGGGVEAALLALLARLLVACAAPGAGLLRELVAKLLGVLAGGASGPGFRAALLALPPEGRERLQAVLRPVGGQAASAAAAAGARRPTIALKTFAPVTLPR